MFTLTKLFFNNTLIVLLKTLHLFVLTFCTKRKRGKVTTIEILSYLCQLNQKVFSTFLVLRFSGDELLVFAFKEKYSDFFPFYK